MFYVCVATEIAPISVSVANLLVLPVLGNVSTSGLHLIVFFSSRTMLLLAEMYRACPGTLSQLLRSPSYHFPSQSYNCFWYTSAILEFLGERSVGQGQHIHHWKTCLKNIGIATEIASISVSVAILLVLPVLVVSTSGLYLMVFSIVGRCPYKWKWIERAQKLCRSRWDHVKMSSSRLVITISSFGGFLFPVCICRREKSVSTRVAGLTAHENMDIPVRFFHLRHAQPEILLKPVFRHLGCPLFPTKIWGTVIDMGKFLLGFCSQYTPWVKKGDTILLSISLLNIDRFSQSFTDVLSWNCAIKLSIKILNWSLNIEV